MFWEMANWLLEVLGGPLRDIAWELESIAMVTGPNGRHTTLTRVWS